VLSALRRALELDGDPSLNRAAQRALARLEVS